MFVDDVLFCLWCLDFVLDGRTGVAPMLVKPVVVVVVVVSSLEEDDGDCCCCDCEWCTEDAIKAVRFGRLLLLLVVCFESFMKFPDAGHVMGDTGIRIG